MASLKDSFNRHRAMHKIDVVFPQPGGPERRMLGQFPACEK